MSGRRLRSVGHYSNPPGQREMDTAPPYAARVCLYRTRPCLRPTVRAAAPALNAAFMACAVRDATSAAQPTGRVAVSLHAASVNLEHGALDLLMSGEWAYVCAFVTGIMNRARWRIGGKTGPVWAAAPILRLIRPGESGVADLVEVRSSGWALSHVGLAALPHFAALSAVEYRAFVYRQCTLAALEA